ncbi:MAG TPA: polyribonucleotide nucleotidyltransferase [Candidatus Aminicenantes bacterium]|nr:polyribonucleotide nucleotidyltransferase [Candidatus Aminicenantes bacterium]HRY65333.1 polyribonucleotide nucleotidyltransferase [Candidatus Aminicenantes bacterium]HRZ72199.1 polyribonucleotide nucleotidyltransferase [Candidatus Aminicenantes bacterium]
MSNTISLEINRRTLSVEINRVAKQADGSALVRYGDTMMLVTATSRKELKEGKDFLPLIVDYRENTYAAGKIPGGFFKREGRPSEREILMARLIDRPIRPLFPDGYFYDTQIVGLLLSADLESEPDTLGLIGASVALYFSDIPFTTPLGAVKVGIVDGALVVNPTDKELDRSPLNMTVVSNESGIIMIEAGAQEIEEEKVLEGLALAHQENQRIIQAQKDLFARLGIKKREFTAKPFDPEKLAKLEAEQGPALLQAMQVKGKKASEAALAAVREAALALIPEDKPEEKLETKALFYKLEEKLFREIVLKKKLRTDGRGFDDIRPISAEVGLLTRTHGSALFTRGETQALATVTLGTFEDAQRLDSLGEESKKRFMLHYNFPSFSVGEVGFLRAPGRREIGHGALAEKAILPAIPDMETFPYTIRIVSDILESNGSSSQATVCGGVLALMDAGVPLKMVVAGIAMGLVTSDCGDYAILTDIAGLEDHFGDMDFKMAGTEKGVTAIQLDLKIPCVTLPMLREIMTKSKAARIEVLGRMKAAIAEPRKDISVYAPRILILNINPEKVGEVIGPAGKVIKKIVSQTGAKIDIEEDGKILIASPDMSAAEAAKQMILDLTAEAELGKIYTGKVVRLEEYGAFVEIMPNLVGLLHISEVAPYRIASIHDVLHLGDTVTVKVVSIDPADNKIRLSKKACEEGGGENPEATPRPPAPRRYPREHGSDRRGGGDRGGRGRF